MIVMSVGFFSFSFFPPAPFIRVESQPKEIFSQKDQDNTVEFGFKFTSHYWSETTNDMHRNTQVSSNTSILPRRVNNVLK